MGRPHFVTDYELVSLLMSAVIAVFVYTKYSIKSTRNLQFKMFVISILFYSIADILSFQAINFITGPIFRYVTQSMFLFASAFTPFVLFSYTCSYVIPDKKNPFKSIIPLIIFTLAFFVLFVLNYRSHFLFYFDERTAFAKGRAFKILQMTASLCSLGSIICFITGHSNFSTRQLLALIVFTFATMVMPIIQGIFALYRIIAFTYSIFLMQLLLVIETPDEQALVETVNELEEWKEKLKIRIEEKTHEAERNALKTERLTMQMVYALAEIVDAKDKYTSGHSSRVARYSKMLAQKKGFGKEECDEIFMMGILHDIGKVAISSKIINKPGPLNDKEISISRKHPEIGSQILEKVTMLPKLRMGVRWHHERIDGLGYPDGLKGNEIPIEAKIIAVADAYDAMTSFRSYRSLMTQEQVRKELANESGTHFDTEIVRLMFELIDADKEYKMHEYKKAETTNVL